MLLLCFAILFFFCFYLSLFCFGFVCLFVFVFAVVILLLFVVALPLFCSLFVQCSSCVCTVLPLFASGCPVFSWCFACFGLFCLLCVRVLSCVVFFALVLFSCSSYVLTFSLWDPDDVVRCRSGRRYFFPTAMAHSADLVGTVFCKYVLNSLMAPVLVVRRSVGSVMDVLSRIRTNGVSENGCAALIAWLEVVSRQGPCSPFSVGTLRYSGTSSSPSSPLPATSSCFCRKLTLFQLFHDFVRQVVVSCRE